MCFIGSVIIYDNISYMPVCIYAVIINDIFIYHADVGNGEGSWEKEGESGLDKRVR